MTVDKNNAHYRSGKPPPVELAEGTSNTKRDDTNPDDGREDIDDVVLDRVCAGAERRRGKRKFRHGGQCNYCKYQEERDEVPTCKIHVLVRM